MRAQCFILIGYFLSHMNVAARLTQEVFSFLNPWRGYFARPLLWVLCISNESHMPENLFKKKTGKVAIFPV